jgi:hypothetical protein
MYGPGPGPGSARSSGGNAARIAERALLACCSLFSCGVFACVPLFRIAFLRGRWYDWAAATFSLLAPLAAFIVVGRYPEASTASNSALVAILVFGLITGGYYLSFDLRQQRYRPGHPPPYFAPSPEYTTSVPPRPGYGYTYPQQYPDVPFPPRPLSPPHIPAHGDPTPRPLSVRPDHYPRIDQVRAELDELSDLLRKGQETSASDWTDERESREDR